MKQKAIGWVILSAIFLFTQVAVGQTSANKSKDNDRSDDIGDRIGKKIERFISDITREFSIDDQFDAFNPDTLPGKSRKHEVDLDLETERKSKTYEGSKTIEKGDSIETNVVVKGGDLTLYGYVDGDVLVVGGTLYVKRGARITGNVRIINGDYEREDGAIVEGYVDKTGSKNVGYREDRRRFSHPSKSFSVPWVNENANLDNFVFRYNRVEGVFLGLGTEKKYYWDGERKFNSYGSVGWGFRSHTWRGNLGIARQFPLRTGEGDELLEVGVEGYSLTNTKDQWLIDIHENTAAALLIHEDFRDYFERNGFSAHVAYYGQNDYLKTELSVAYLAGKYASLSNNADWAFFGGEKMFRSNPPVNDGSMRSILASAGVSSVSKTSRGPEGWSVFGSFEYGPRTLGGIFNFDQYILDIRRFQPISSYQDNLNFRVRAGTSDGTLPIQKAYRPWRVGNALRIPLQVRDREQDGPTECRIYRERQFPGRSRFLAELVIPQC